MPRKARIDAPGALHHIIIRGIERTITEARRILCYLAVRKLGYTCSDVARTLGISPVTVSKAVASGSTLAEMGKIQQRILGS